MSNINEQNKILRQGLGVSQNDSYPAFLEGIAMALGYTNRGGETLASSASRIADALERIANHLENPS